MKQTLLTIAFVALGLPAVAMAQMADKTTSSTTTTSTTSEPKPMVVHHHHHHHHYHHRTMHKSMMTKTDASGTETVTKTDVKSTPK